MHKYTVASFKGSMESITKDINDMLDKNSTLDVEGITVLSSRQVTKTMFTYEVLVTFFGKEVE